MASFFSQKFQHVVEGTIIKRNAKTVWLRLPDGNVIVKRYRQLLSFDV